MAEADPATMLERLREPWEDMTGSRHYREVEMERKRWMLTALYHLDEASDTNRQRAPAPRPPRGEQRKVLALHESHGRHLILQRGTERDGRAR